MAKLPDDLIKMLEGEKPEKYPTSFHLTRSVVADFKRICGDRGESASHVVEALIVWYMSQLDKP